MHRIAIAVWSIAAGCAIAAGAASAQSYPNHPIKVVVPWPPGQATDVAARMVSDKLSTALGQPIVVDNRAGAGGTIGSDAVAKSAPDGYTLLAGSSGPISIGPNVQTVPYDPLKDFAPISLIVQNPYLLVVNPSVPAKNVKELIALLKANPGKYQFSSSGAGSTSHLLVAMFNHMAGVEAVHVPYKGSSPSVNDVASGLITYTLETVPAVNSYVSSGRLRALAVSTAKRLGTLPDMPTIAESGLPGYDMFAWVGFLAPAGTPSAITEKLSADIRKVLQDPDFRAKFAVFGAEPTTNTPAEFARFLQEQSDRYGSIAREAHIHID